MIEASFEESSELIFTFILIDMYVPLWDSTPELLQRKTEAIFTVGDL